MDVSAGAEEVLAAAILVMMALLGGLVVFSQGSAIAPFIYTIF